MLNCKKIVVFIFFVVLFSAGFSQYKHTYDTTRVDYTKIYYNWEDASWMPRRVCNLYLINQLYDTLSPLIKEMRNLRVLQLNGNRFKALPDEIGYLPYLKHLNLGNNKLHFLPKTFVKLDSVIELDLSNNYLDSLPYNIGNLKKVKKLYLQNNRLKSIPRSISKMQNLEVLNLSNNYLDSLPSEIRLLTNLKTLILEGNNINLHTKDILKRFLTKTNIVY